MMKCDFCDAEIKGADVKTVMDMAWAHMKEAHPAEVAKMMAMSKEDQDKGMAAAQAKIVDVA